MDTSRAAKHFIVLLWALENESIRKGEKERRNPS